MLSVDFHLERLCNLIGSDGCAGNEPLIPQKGIYFTDCLQQRSLDAASYFPTSLEEMTQIDYLRMHRHRLVEYSHLIDQCEIDSKNIPSLVYKIQEDIERLSDIWGRSVFCFPGGTVHHAVCYEFVQEADGTYSFLIYNRGEGCNDPDLHGNVFLVRNGKQIARTRVQIRGLAKEDLQNEVLLKVLILFQHDEYATMEDVYGKIKKHLLEKASGWVREAPREREWLVLTRMLSLNMNGYDFYRLQEVEKELLFDPDFHTLQVSGSCTESNTQTPESFIIDPNFRRRLKLHAIQSTYNLIQEHVPQPLATKVALKIETLLEKIDFWKWMAYS